MSRHIGEITLLLAALAGHLILSPAALADDMMRQRNFRNNTIHQGESRLAPQRPLRSGSGAAAGLGLGTENRRPGLVGGARHRVEVGGRSQNNPIYQRFERPGRIRGDVGNHSLNSLTRQREQRQMLQGVAGGGAAALEGERFQLRRERSISDPSRFEGLGSRTQRSDGFQRR